MKIKKFDFFSPRNWSDFCVCLEFIYVLEIEREITKRFLSFFKVILKWLSIKQINKHKKTISFYNQNKSFDQFPVTAVSGPISPRWMNGKCPAALCTTITNSCQEREREMEKAPRCELKCRHYCLLY